MAAVTLVLVSVVVVLFFAGSGYAVAVAQVVLPVVIGCLNLAGIVSITLLETGRSFFAPKFIVWLADGFDSLFSAFNL